MSVDTPVIGACLRSPKRLTTRREAGRRERVPPPVRTPSLDDAYDKTPHTSDVYGASGIWAWADSNGRPHAYQACALTN